MPARNSITPPIPVLPVSPRELIANSYYEKLLAEPDIQLALLPHNLEKNPDESFKKALLFPLLEIDPPKQCLFLLIDAIDEGLQPGQQSDSRSPSRTVAELVSRHQHLLPQWLLLVCTARRHCKLTRMFTGFRKITLDELARAHVSADVQRYVLSRLDTEPKLRARVSHDGSAAAAAAAALDHLRIKSDGCLLYLEKVLDGVADGFIALREIREIPGTLNGLYLWLAQRLFHGRRFAKVRLLLDVLLAARCGVTEEMLYKCLLTKEYSVTREDFNRRLHLLRRIVVMERATGYVQIFHHSFAAWLLDVKHCTRRYLCSLSDGHAALAMYYTLMCGRRYLCSLSDGHAALAMYYTLMCGRLSAMEINNYVFHMTHLEQHLLAQKKSKDNEDEVLDLHTIILLWVLDSGCDLESALKRENDALRVAIIDDQHLETKTEDKEEGSDCEEKETNSERVSLEKLMPGLKAEGNQVSGGRAADARALAALLQLRPHPSQTNCVSEEMAESTEPTVEEEEPVPLDPNIVFELATSGDHDALASVLKRNPALISAVDATGGTALHSAARAGRAAAVRVICAAGADAQAPDNDGWSPLRAAAWAGHPDVVDVLLEYGCDVDCVDGDNRTALRAAAWSGHEAVVRRLLAAGAAPERADAEGRTALMAAAYMGHADIVKALLLAGADPNHADADGA
ncbi:hypothetical protein O0L34_g12231 [Tuta absoluta]|nr:hypothetical protein O0L34_g12231 [Tuta absoluta]KAJ2943425.1 hypothetical protein O0L34_g12231 [Tuta absoluta]